MNVIEESVEINIEWGDKIYHYPKNEEAKNSFFIISLLVISLVIFLKRKRKNKKYFI